ncbi:hypothetical protein [Deinococcus multiflagellatus]|uniref:Uncharacterized protein n=1 Tax=Deinococcus multiflagellatus TaxID=1656887 RepID=A0ABW1ZPV4_9DEIO|nr:hypothetical protein [Deinococcus multiflagellatus]MBZ9714969.1 hypothetical protein [Deinococcus multiflagellatus]
MKRFVSVLLLVSVFGTSVQAASQPLVSGPGGYQYTPGLTPAQQQQLKASLEAVVAPPTVVGTGLKPAVTAILNSRSQISGLVGPLPRELEEALNRAAIRTPVRLVMATKTAPVTAALARAKRILIPTSSVTTMIAADHLLITVTPQGITVLKSSHLAAQIHARVDQVETATAPAR